MHYDSGHWSQRRRGNIAGILFTAYLGVAEVAGVGGGGVTDAGRGVDICQERPRAGQGHVDNQTGLKHLSIRSKI